MHLVLAEVISAGVSPSSVIQQSFGRIVLLRESCNAQVPGDASRPAPVDRKGLTLGQHEVPELLQRIGLAHLVGSFQRTCCAKSLQDLHTKLVDMQASQPSAALQVLFQLIPVDICHCSQALFSSPFAYCLPITAGFACVLLLILSAIIVLLSIHNLIQMCHVTPAVLALPCALCLVPKSG